MQPPENHILTDQLGENFEKKGYSKRFQLEKCQWVLFDKTKISR